MNWANANVPKYSTQITYEYVDLGLPSGTLWATMNVGATGETDPGLYFAWGETEGYTAEQVGVDKQFAWADYKFNPSGDSETFTKYNLTDNKVVLDSEDDAASVNMGGKWHMPTGDQCRELFKETKNGFVTNAGTFTQYAWDNTNGYSSPTSTTAAISGWDTAGYFFFKNTYTSVTEAITAEDYLFIPAAGSCENGEVGNVGIYGLVWASALSSSMSGAWSFIFDSGGASVSDYFGRFAGQSVRGVIGNIDK